MKILNRKLFTLLVSSLVIFTSCKKNIDLLPSDVIDATKAFQTVNDLELGTIGVYSALNYENSLYVNSIMSDEARWATDNNSRNYGLAHKWDFDPGNGDATASWANLYTVIDRANRILAVIDATPAADATELATKSRIKGELLAIRAFSHFELLRWFAPTYESTSLGVPIKLVSSISLPARNTFAEVMKQVNMDLTDAKTLIPATYTTTDLSRFTRAAVSAIQSRAALYAKDWNNAIVYADEALVSKPTLLSKANFSGIWNDTQLGETFFQLRRNSPTGYLGTLYRDANNDVFFSPSFKLNSTFDIVNDVRYVTYIKNDLTLPSTKERWLVVKYPGQTTTNKFNNVKVIRNAELLLIKAEANAEKATPDFATAASLINTIRTARIGTGNFVPVLTYATKQAAIDDIMLERYKELAFEGHRFFDLRRKQLPVVRTNDDITVSNGIPLTLSITSRNYMLPIPQVEIFANKNMEQNPTYK